MHKLIVPHIRDEPGRSPRRRPCAQPQARRHRAWRRVESNIPDYSGRTAWGGRKAPPNSAPPTITNVAGALAFAGDPIGTQGVGPGPRDADRHLATVGRLRLATESERLVSIDFVEPMHVPEGRRQQAQSRGIFTSFSPSRDPHLITTPDPALVESRLLRPAQTARQFVWTLHFVDFWKHVAELAAWSLFLRQAQYHSLSGAGKTHLKWAIGYEATKQGCSACTPSISHAPSSPIMRSRRATASDSGITNPDLLIIHEPGCRNPAGTDEAFLASICRRCEQPKP